MYITESVKHDLKQQNLQALVAIFVFKLLTSRSFKVSCKEISLNFALKMPYLYIFGQEFEKTMVIIEINTLKFVQMQSLVQKKKTSNLELEMACLGIFGL